MFETSLDNSSLIDLAFTGDNKSVSMRVLLAILVNPPCRVIFITMFHPYTSVVMPTAFHALLTALYSFPPAPYKSIAA